MGNGNVGDGGADGGADSGDGVGATARVVSAVPAVASGAAA
jgi:hypothetical protein